MADSWRCFHCDEVFTDHEAAMDHFGLDCTQPAACERAKEIEAACRGMYGKNWDGPEDKMPGEKMKNVWRKYARLAIEAVDELRASR